MSKFQNLVRWWDLRGGGAGHYRGLRETGMLFMPLISYLVKVTSFVPYNFFYLHETE